jgi:hypothetical protein
MALFTHLSSVFVLLGQGLMVLWLQWSARKDPSRDKRDITGPLVAVGVCGCICLVVFGPLIPGIWAALNNVATPEVTQGQTADIKKWRNPFWTLAETLASFGVLGAVLPVAAGLIGWGAVKLCRKSPAAIGGVFLSIPICFIALVLGHMRIWPRYFFVDIGILLSALVVGSFALADFSLARVRLLLKDRTLPALSQPAARLWLRGLGVGAMVVASIVLLKGNYAAPKQNFTGAHAFVERARGPDDRVATVGLARVAYHDYLAPSWTPVETMQSLKSLSHGKSSTRTWVVVAFPDHMRKHYPEIDAELARSYTMLRRFKGTLSEGDILVYQTKTAEPDT